jgi:uncharacterized iron-regulated membrane protein
MGVWQRWVRQPQRVWLRRAAFQIHLWTGLGIGLYVVILSLTGSVLVYRNELNASLATPRPRFDPDAAIIGTDRIRELAQRAYPGWTVGDISERVSRRNPTISVTFEREGQTRERLFNPYTGEDLGDAYTKGEQFVLWLVRLHDELLLDRDGRWWNGLGSAIFTILVLTGAVVWWPGVTRWKRSLGVKWRSGWRRFNWDLHSAMGFWLLLFMVMWGISGWYLGMPEPLTDMVEWISDPEGNPGERPGDIALTWLARLHFGRWRTGWLKAAWAVVGLVPAVMFVTGAIMWWNRVLRKRPSRDLNEVAV